MGNDRVRRGASAQPSGVGRDVSGGVSRDSARGVRAASPSGKIRPKMPVAQRAKQFMPFAAVTGLETALRNMEREHAKVAKLELSEDAVAAINAVIAGLHDGEHVVVTYFVEGEYVDAAGAFGGLDLVEGTMRVGETNILIDSVKAVRLAGPVGSAE